MTKTKTKTMTGKISNKISPLGFKKTCDGLDLGHVVENRLVNLELFFENRFDVGQVKLQLELAIAIHKVFAFKLA